METRWSRLTGWVAGIGLFFVSGCVPVDQWTRGRSSQEPPVQSTRPAAKVTAGEKSLPAPAGQELRPPAVVSPPAPPAPPQVPPGYRVTGDDPLVAERIAYYQQKKGEWEALVSRLAGGNRSEAVNVCMQEADLILTGYQRLQKLESGLKPWEVVGQDLRYASQQCDKHFTETQAALVSTQESASQPVPEVVLAQIRQQFEAGLYQEVVAACEALPKGADGLVAGPRELKALYWRAVIKLGRLPEAAEGLTRLLGEPGHAADPSALEIRILTGDVLLALGRAEEARQVYEGAAKALAPVVAQQEWVAAHLRLFSEQAKPEDVEGYRQILQAYLSSDGKQVPPALTEGVASLQGRAGTPAVALAKMLHAKATAQSQSWARNKMIEIRTQLAAKNLPRARELMAQLSAAVPPAMRASVSQLEEEVNQAERLAQEAPPATVAAGGETSPWDEALDHFEHKRYDEAIVAFQNLQEGEHGAEAKAKMAEATELAAAAMRQQAAALYAKAKKTFDPEARRQTLLSSRALLQTLLERYPSASVVDKARQNMKVLDSELGAGVGAPP